MARLSEQQLTILQSEGNRIVSACPGSGKTRLLVEQVKRFVVERNCPGQKVVGLTFTNRAADEVIARLENEEIQRSTWVGTIHSFCLQWILRPYRGYVAECRLGFVVADDKVAKTYLTEESEAEGLAASSELDSTQRRDGSFEAVGEQEQRVLRRYKQRLRAARELDYNDVLFLSYRTLRERPEVASTIGRIVSAFCIDEVQDLQDLQYGIVAAIWESSGRSPALFMVGDPDQAIYGSMGAITKTVDECEVEFAGAGFTEHSLLDNYRSTQRIVDLSKLIRPGPAVTAVGTRARERGVVTRALAEVEVGDLADFIADRVQAALLAKVPPHEIAVLAPHWRHVVGIGRKLAARLPDVPFDAPGLSPLGGNRESVWFRLSRLALAPLSNISPRGLVWLATDAVVALEAELGVALPEMFRTPSRLLASLRGMTSASAEGVPFLRDILGQLLEIGGFSEHGGLRLRVSLSDYLMRAQARIDESEGTLPADLESFRRCFAPREGVVVSTLHGCKGEEYDTVVAFGLLRGYVPNWNVIINGTESDSRSEESKLLYVVSTRAKRRLHLVSESGRRTRAMKPLKPSDVVSRLEFEFD